MEEPNGQRHRRLCRLQQGERLPWGNRCKEAAARTETAIASKETHTTDVVLGERDGKVLQMKAGCSCLRALAERRETREALGPVLSCLRPAAVYRTCKMPL